MEESEFIVMLEPLTKYLQSSAQVNGDVYAHSMLVRDAFQAHREFIDFAKESAKPPQNQIMSLLKETSDKITAIQNYREEHRSSPLFNHLSAVSESIAALGWVTVSPAPAPYIKEMIAAAEFYTNRVLKEWKGKDPEQSKVHANWTKAWIELLSTLQEFVKKYHTTGLVWEGKRVLPGLPPPPPPPSQPDWSGILESGGKSGDTDRSALFADINKGQDVTKNLRKVTSEMQTHKNPTLRQGPAPFKPTPYKSTVQTNQTKSSKKPDTEVKPLNFYNDGKKTFVEYLRDNHEFALECSEMKDAVYLFKCENSTVNVKGKINSITMDSCKKTSIVFESLVSAVEFINCQSVKMQVLGKVPTISIDKTDGCQIFLSNDSLDVEIISAKSSEMNVMIPKGGDDYTEIPIPEQFKTKINSNKTLSTEVIESKG